MSGLVDMRKQPQISDDASHSIDRRNLTSQHAVRPVSHIIPNAMEQSCCGGICLVFTIDLQKVVLPHSFDLLQDAETIRQADIERLELHNPK